jgi:hypothetical protein
LQRVEQLCHLKREELFGVEVSNPVGAIEAADGLLRQTPECFGIGTGFIQAVRSICESASVVRRRIDPEMHELFGNKLINVFGFRRIAPRGKIPHRRQRCVPGLGHADRFSMTIS